MKPTVVFVYSGLKQYELYTARFLQSYFRFPPELDHSTVIVLNGIPVTSDVRAMFSVLPNVRFLLHDDSGWDIGAFQRAAKEGSGEMMVFFGSSTYFTRPGWLRRMFETYQKHGYAQYGAMGNRGDIPVKVWPHIRTTAFWMSSKLMASYPHTVVRPEQRHPFEHGPECFTNWCTSRGVISYVVTWAHVLKWENWDDDPNGFQRGNQSSLLAGDRMCERPYYPNNRCRNNVNLECVPWKRSLCWPCLAPA